MHGMMKLSARKRITRNPLIGNSQEVLTKLRNVSPHHGFNAEGY